MSNKYPSWWDKKVTVYNRYADPTSQIVEWKKTVLSDCFWKFTTTTLVVNGAVQDIATITCRIPQSSKYCDPMTWNSNSDKRSRFFTLKQDDIIVLGNCGTNINEYISGSRSTDLLKAYQSSSMQIKEVSIDTMTGMNNKHYRVVGR